MPRNSVRRMSARNWKLSVVLVTILAARAAQTYAEDGLPWEKDYATALTKAKGAHRPVFLMLTATCCFGQLA